MKNRINDLAWAWMNGELGFFFDYKKDLNLKPETCEEKKEVKEKLLQQEIKLLEERIESLKAVLKNEEERKKCKHDWDEHTQPKSVIRSNNMWPKAIFQRTCKKCSAEQITDEYQVAACWNMQNIPHYFFTKKEEVNE